MQKEQKGKDLQNGSSAQGEKYLLRCHHSSPIVALEGFEPTERMCHTMARDDRRLQLVRLDRWLQARYERSGWARGLAWIEDAAAGAAIGLLAVLLSRSC
jgi:hypothetical protein